jgi:UDP-2,3-diacylglucosamine pyrophosphatase LpxH
VRSLFGLRYWSFSAWAKFRVKKAVNFIGEFETVVSEEAKRIGVDGVICGHIHHATIEKMNDVEYINTGDWVESCTAVLEHFDGRMELVKWTQMRDEKSSGGKAIAQDSRADDNRIVRLPRAARNAAKIAG